MYCVTAPGSKAARTQKHTMHFINNLNALRHDEIGNDWYQTPEPVD